MTAPRTAFLVVTAFAAGAAATVYGVWLWVDHGLGKASW